MSSPLYSGQDRFRRTGALSFPALLVLTMASACTGAIVALVMQRLVQRRQTIEVLAAPPPVRHIEPGVQAPTGQQDVKPRPAGSSASGAGSLPDAVATGLTASRAAELERLAAEDDDVLAGDGTDSCPAGFPVKGNGRSGIYHWPGGRSYDPTRPTLCFRNTDAAERAGFRPAKR